jgi:hypothetical protein
LRSKSSSSSTCRARALAEQEQQQQHSSTAAAALAEQEQQQHLQSSRLRSTSSSSTCFRSELSQQHTAAADTCRALAERRAAAAAAQQQLPQVNHSEPLFEILNRLISIAAAAKHGRQPCSGLFRLLRNKVEQGILTCFQASYL